MRILLLLISVLLVGNLKAQDYSFIFKVTQNKKEVVAKDLVYELNPKQHNLVLEIEAKGLDGFLVGVTLDKDVYLSALGEGDLEVSWFNETGMAEELFNPNKSILVSNDAPSYWYFDSKDDHRFDRDPVGEPQAWKAKRSIHQFEDLLNKRTVLLKDYKGSMYLFFYKPNYDEDYNLVDLDVLYHAELKFR